MSDISSSLEESEMLSEPPQMAAEESNHQQSENQEDVNTSLKVDEERQSGVAQLLEEYENNSKVREILDIKTNIIFECNACKGFFRSLEMYVDHQMKNCDGSKSTECAASSVVSETTTNAHGNFMSESPYPVRMISGGSVANTGNSKAEVFQRGVWSSLGHDSHSHKIVHSGFAELYRRQCEDTAIVNEQGKVVRMCSEAELPMIISEMESSQQLNEVDEPLNAPVSHSEENTSHKKHSCPYCTKGFSTLIAFRMHLKSEHEVTDFRYTCTFCTSYFPSLWSVKRHIYNLHKKTGLRMSKILMDIEEKAKEEYASKHATNTSSKNNRKPQDEKPQGTGKGLRESARLRNKNTKTEYSCDTCGRKFGHELLFTVHTKMCRNFRSSERDGFPLSLPSEYSSSLCASPVPSPPYTLVSSGSFSCPVPSSSSLSHIPLTPSTSSASPHSLPSTSSASPASLPSTSSASPASLPSTSFASTAYLPSMSSDSPASLPPTSSPVPSTPSAYIPINPSFSLLPSTSSAPPNPSSFRSVPEPSTSSATFSDDPLALLFQSTSSVSSPSSSSRRGSSSSGEITSNHSPPSEKSSDDDDRRKMNNYYSLRSRSIYDSDKKIQIQVRKNYNKEK